MRNRDTVRFIGSVCVAAVCLTTQGGFVRPNTTRRYLQAPLSESVSVFLREGKITFGDIIHSDDWASASYYKGKQPAHGVWLVHGTSDVSYDFAKAVLNRDPEGMPVHSQTWRDGDLEVTLTACQSFGRQSAVQARLLLTNRGTAPVSEKIGFLLRAAPENKLIFSAPDIYDYYAPRMSDWKMLPTTFSEGGKGVLSDKDRFVAFSMNPVWDDVTGTARFTFSLAPNACGVLEFTIGKGSVVCPSFSASAGGVRSEWAKLLARAKNRTPFVRSQIVQILQCFGRPTEGDFVLPRQGGLQRYVWPGETVHVAEALDRLGYGDYAAMAVDFLMRFAQPNGRIGPFGTGWASETAYCIETVSRHCLLTDDIVCWRRHRDAVMRGFGWIKVTRAETTGGKDGAIAGLFPPLKATDAERRFQHWGMTDLVNEGALRVLAAAAGKFGDARLGEIKAEGQAYRAVIEGILDRWRRASSGKDTFFIPLAPDGRNEAQFRAENLFYFHPGAFAENGYLTEDEMLRQRTWLIREGIASDRGLYQRHGGKVWYTTWSEYQWSLGWRRVGRTDLSRQALDALLAWSVTDEDYVGERICEQSPWYFPWSPNASGSARILKMLLNEGLAGE